MCGICGIWGSADPRPLRPMMQALRHRGPDGSGVHTDSRIALGHTRLAILDLSSAGEQPMANEDGSVWINYNGEIYNFREERALLERQGHRFRSDSDTEVALRAYLEYGPDFLLRMRGMFALAIYDRRAGEGRERLLLARDPLGIKPLLYAGDARRLVFASELKALLASGLVERRIDPSAIEHLLAFGSIAQPATALRDVRMLLPGHMLVIDGTRMEVTRYYSLSTDRFEGLAAQPYDEQVRRLREELEATIRAHMVSDVPVGAFLSGGIDSGVVAGLMARMSPQPLRTFSVGFEAEGAAIDETDDAARAAALIGSDHRRIVVTGQEVRDQLPRIATALDQPSVDGVNSYFVSAAASGHVKVAISGTGGDELFAGYPWFGEMMRAHAHIGGRNSGARRTALGVMEWLSRFSPHAGRARERIEASGDLLTLYTRQYQLFGGALARRLISRDAAPATTPLRARDRAAAGDELPHASIVARTSALCLRGYTQNQLLRDIDAVSMAHSLEIRVPLLDRLLTEFALALPDDAKLNASPPSNRAASYRDTGAKRVLIDAARDVLPPHADAQPKSGFGMPFGAWLKGPLRDIYNDTLAESTVLKRGLFDAAAVSNVKADFEAGRVSWALPWVLVMFELWARGVLDSTPESP